MKYWPNSPRFSPKPCLAGVYKEFEAAERELEMMRQEGETEEMASGYRVYYVQRGELLILLLCGGDKSTQDSGRGKAKPRLQRPSWKDTAPRSRE